MDFSGRRYRKKYPVAWIRGRGFYPMVPAFFISAISLSEYPSPSMI
jgi:hypothetical protein